MNRTFTIALSMLVALLFVAPASAQQDGDFRTTASGDWSDPQIWETYDGSSWGPTAEAPSGTGMMTVVATDDRMDSVFVDVELTVAGTLVNQGIVEYDEADTLITVADGGVYQHDRESGALPSIRWDAGSTLLMTGTEAVAPENRRQNYHDIVFETPGLISNLHMDLDSVTIGGDIRVLDTGPARWYLTSIGVEDDPADTTAEISILGDIIVQEGNFAVQGTSNPYSQFIVHHYGDVMVTGGNFSVSRGSQPLGSTMWYLYEGDFHMENAETKASTQDPMGAFFVFTKDGTQTLTLGDSIDFVEFPIMVESGTTLDMGLSVLEGSGWVVVEEGAGIGTALQGGIDAIFSSLAEPADQVTLADNSSYVFNGTEAQVTSETMPTVVDDLTINNEAGVALSQETTINGVLSLQAGVFDNNTPFTLGSDAEVAYEGGSLAVSVGSDDEPGNGIPQTFFVDQNYPNPFNPSTVIRYGLPSPSDVTITVYNLLGQQVAASFEGRKPAGVHDFSFVADGLSSGMYIYRVDAGDRTVTKRMLLIE